MRSARLYLVDILEAADAIARFIHGRTHLEFMTDDYFQSAVITKFGIIGESAGQLSDELRRRLLVILTKEGSLVELARCLAQRSFLRQDDW
jgi:uncharacterized protein with HEPN domain